MRLALLMVGLGAQVLGSAAAAQGITEEEFLSGVGRESAATRALAEGVGRAEAARQRAGTLANPRLDFWREQPDGNPRVTNWTLSWTPPLDGRFGLGKEAAEVGVSAAQERLVADRAGLHRELRAAFAAWSSSGQRRDALQRHCERVHGLAEMERQRARVGESAGLSARRLTLAEAEGRASLASAEAAHAKAAALARAWRPDLPAGAVPLPAPLPEPPVAMDPAASPELRALDLEARQAELENRRAGRFLAFPTLQLGWQQISDRGAAQGGPILAAGWTIPLFDRDQAARIEAGRRQQVAAARLEVVRARLGARIEGSAAAYRTLLAACREAGLATADGDRVIAAATAAFQAGEAPLTDLLDGLRAALLARLGEIELRAQALDAHRELEAALGRPLVGGGV